MDEDKAIRAAKLTLGGMFEKRRAKEAKQRAPGQIAPSKYLPGVPRAVHANGGYVPAAALPVGRLAVARPVYNQQPTVLDALGSLAGIGETARGFSDTIDGRDAFPPQDGHAGRAEAGGGMSPEAVAAYNALLEAHGQPLTVVSDYRTPSENAAAKGAKGSQHMHGNAYDIDTSDMTYDERLALADKAWEAGFRGFGFYDNNMHFDVGGPRAWGPSHSRDSIPEWAQPWAQERYGYADGGEVADLGQAREQKQLRTFHGGMMDDIHTRMTHLMEAHQKAVDAGVFDGYELGDVLQGSAHPMRIKAKFMRQWKPNPMVMQAFDRMGAKPTIIEHEGKQYIPMLRYQTGVEGQDGFQEGDAYLDGIKAARYQKMGGLRSVKADGGSVSDPRTAFLAGNHPAVPDVVYHGSAPKIATKGWTSEVDEEQTQKNRDAMDFREFRPSSYGNYGPGIYLTDKPGTASQYAMGIRADQNEEKPYGQVMKLHVSMKQPFTDNALRHPAWRDYIRKALTQHYIPHDEDRNARDAFLKKLDDGTATVRDMFLRETPRGTLVNQWGNDEVHDTIRRSGFDGIIAHRPDGSKEIVAFKPEQVKSAISARKFDPTNPDMTFSDGGSVPQKTVKAYKLFRTKGDGKLYPLFVNADKPVPVGEWLEAEEGPQGKAQGKVKSKLGDLAYRPGWHAGDLPIATHIGGKSDPSLKKPDYRPDNHVWAEVEMAADKDWQSVADSRGKGVKAHITDQVPLGGFYRYKTNPNMTGNWLIGGNMKVNRVLSDDEVKAINDAAGTADLPRLPRGAFAAGGAAMFEGIHEDLQDEQGNPLELWHGTPQEKEFEAFDDEKLGSTRDHGFYGRGHYLTPDLEGASEYAGSHADEGTVMGPLHATLKNPYIWDTSSDNASHRTLRDLQSMGIMREKSRLEPWDNLQRHHIEPFMSEMKKRGHDGVVVRSASYDDRPHQVSEVVVFNPNMIKHKDAEVFDPNDPRIRRAEGGEVDDNTPIDMTTARLLRNFNQNSTGPTPQAEGVFNRLADRYEKSRVAYDAAKADGVFDRVQIGDVYKYKPLPNTSPMEVVGHRMMPVERWSGDKPPKYVYHDHYPVADIKKDGETKPYSIERMEDADLYDRIKGKPRMVKAGGGSVGGMMLRMRRAGINTKDDFWNRWRDHMRAKAGPDPRLSSIMSNDSHFQRIDGMLRVHRQDADQNGLASVLNLYGPPKEQGHMAARIPREMFQDMGIEPTVENAHAAYEALPDDESGRQGFSKGGTPDDQNAGAYLAAPTAQGAISDAGRVRGGSGLLQAQDEAPLEGLPASARIPLTGQVIQAGPDPRIRAVARSYMASAGMPYNPPTKYAKVDPARAKRIAAAYDKMEDNPEHPLTRASYAAMIKETLAQYEAAKAAGFKAEFWHPRNQRDPYEASPRLAVEDVRNNNHMWVYPTYAGYGSGDPISEEDARRNPMLQLTGETWNGIPVTVNDIFRAVHDYFGHAKEGVGFRHDGEENAWRSHASMYSPLARMAMTSETRGQNSWLNFGPHGEKNRTARTEDTEFAPQKVGILPHWVHHEGAEDFMLPNDISGMLHARAKHGSDISKALAVTRSFTKDGGAAIMRLKD